MAEVNYTTEQTKEMISIYEANPNRDTVDLIAKDFGKTVKSVIGKLSREKVYIKKDYQTKRGEKPITKIEMVGHIAEMLSINVSVIAGLTKASKLDLAKLEEAVVAISSDENSENSGSNENSENTGSNENSENSGSSYLI